MALHHFDIVLARRADGPSPRFFSLLDRAASAHGMYFFHCQNHDQAEMLCHAVLSGELRIDCLIDYMGRSFTHDYEFGCAVRAGGGLVLDDPDAVRTYGDKATMHLAMERAGLEMPRTLIWRPDMPARDLNASERGLLGGRIVCKPANGSGSGGVVIGMEPTAAALADARDYDPDDSFLLQEFVQPLDLDGRPAWFRVYNCFGKIMPCFWHPETHVTTPVSPEEIFMYGLHELAHISRRIATISGYAWFSTEIALTIRDGRPAFLPIDYLNNKCFMLTQSEFGPTGMPDMVAEAVAWQIAESTQRHARRAEHRPLVPVYQYAA